MAHFKLGHPVLKWVTDFKSGCDIYTYLMYSYTTRRSQVGCCKVVVREDIGWLAISFSYSIIGLLATYVYLSTIIMAQKNFSFYLFMQPDGQLVIETSGCTTV